VAPNPDSPSEASGRRFCIPCEKRFKTLGEIDGKPIKFCPTCGEDQTFPIESDVPRQQPLFTVPPPPRATAWIVEWKWRPARRVTSRWGPPPEGTTPSRRTTGSGTPVTI
jgi:hypothetical protein